MRTERKLEQVDRGGLEWLCKVAGLPMPHDDEPTDVIRKQVADAYFAGRIAKRRIQEAWESTP